MLRINLGNCVLYLNSYLLSSFINHVYFPCKSKKKLIFFFTKDLVMLILHFLTLIPFI